MGELGSGKLKARVLDERVKGVLEFVKKVAGTGRNQDIVYGDGKEGSVDDPTGERRAFARKVASEGIVLLKNQDAVLPIKPIDGKKKVAVIGPNANAKIISGGGSAALKPTYVVTPLEGLKINKPDGVEIEYSVGCYGQLPHFDPHLPH
jgi:beta-glucosidase